MSPRFSIVIPTYNGSATIEDTIKSILAQSFGEFELIVVDDHSSDSTREIIEYYAHKDNRIRFYQLEYNSGGPATPKNVGVSHALASYVMFCDQDDQYLPQKLAVYNDVLAQYPDTDVLFSDYLYETVGSVAAPKRYLRDHRSFTTSASSYLLPVGNDIYECQNFLGCMCSGIEMGIATLTVAIRRSTLLSQPYIFSSEYKIVDDIDLWLRLAADSRMLYVDHALALYKSSPTSLSASTDRATREAVRFHRINYERFRHRLSSSERRANHALRSRLVYRLACTQINDPSTCMNLAMESLRLHPNMLAVKLVIECSLHRLRKALNLR